MTTKISICHGLAGLSNSVAVGASSHCNLQRRVASRTATSIAASQDESRIQPVTGPSKQGSSMDMKPSDISKQREADRIAKRFADDRAALKPVGYREGSGRPIYRRRHAGFAIQLPEDDDEGTWGANGVRFSSREEPSKPGGIVEPAS